MSGATSAEAEGALPRARRHVAWVLALARWLKVWAERVLAEHAAALAMAAGLGGARVRSLPLREPEVTLLPVPAWPPGLTPSDMATRGAPVERGFSWPPPVPVNPEASTPRLNTLRCLSGVETFALVRPEAGGGDRAAPPRVTPPIPFGFDPEDLLPAEPMTVVRSPSPAMLLRAAAISGEEAASEAPALEEGTSFAPRPSQDGPVLPGDPARELLALLKESQGTPHQPSVPWPEAVPPSPSEASEALAVLLQCERLELESLGE